AMEEMRQQLAHERSSLEAAQRIAEEARERLSMAERAGDAVQEQLAAERTAREGAERAAQQAREQLAKDQSAAKAAAKEAAERVAREAREQEARERARRPPPRLRSEYPSPSSGKPFITWDYR